MFRVSYDRASRNFLDWKIVTRLVKHFSGFPQDLLSEPYVYGSLCSLAMGDSHIGLGIQCGSLTLLMLLKVVVVKVMSCLFLLICGMNCCLAAFFVRLLLLTFVQVLLMIYGWWMRPTEMTQFVKLLYAVT